MRFHLRRSGVAPFPICSLSFSISLIPDTLFSMPAQPGPQCAPCKSDTYSSPARGAGADADTMSCCPPLGARSAWLPDGTNPSPGARVTFPQQPHLFGHLGGNCGTLARREGAGPWGKAAGHLLLQSEPTLVWCHSWAPVGVPETWVLVQPWRGWLEEVRHHQEVSEGFPSPVSPNIREKLV